MCPLLNTLRQLCYLFVHHEFSGGLGEIGGTPGGLFDVLIEQHHSAVTAPHLLITLRHEQAVEQTAVRSGKWTSEATKITKERREKLHTQKTNTESYEGAMKVWPYPTTEASSFFLSCLVARNTKRLRASSCRLGGRSSYRELFVPDSKYTQNRAFKNMWPCVLVSTIQHTADY